MKNYFKVDGTDSDECKSLPASGNVLAVERTQIPLAECRAKQIHFREMGAGKDNGKDVKAIGPTS